MSDYARKIQALLAKADATDSPHERDAFTDAAERLMVKWGVSAAMLAARADRDVARARRVVERRYRVEGTSGQLLAEMVAAVAAPGIAPVITLISRRSPTWWAVGHEDDLDRVEMYIPHIVDQARAAWKTWLKSNRASDSARMAFFAAFGSRVHSRLRRLFLAETSTTTGAELALVDRRSAVDAAFAVMYPHPTTVRPRSFFDWAAAGAGDAAGNAATFAAGAIGGEL